MGKDDHIFDEAFYHFVWQHKLYRTQNLKTVDGLPVEVIHPGLLNNDAGPDFFNVKVKIDGVLWAGNVEIHTKSSDWNVHKHQSNPSYDNVILHVVASYSSSVYNSHGAEVPTLVLDVLPSVYQRYNDLLLEKKTILCSHALGEVDPLFLLNFRDRLVAERLERKSDAMNKALAITNGDWETVFFQTLCRSFGFGLNADAFERLGKSLSHKIIAKHRDNLLQLEALLFGQAGFLMDDDKDDPYFLQLKHEYRFLQAKYKLSPLSVHAWKFLRLRPGNFPTIRIAQLAYLLYSNDSLLHLLIHADAKSVETVFEAKTSAYWLTHYLFGKLSDERKKTLGKSAIQTILINAVAPFLFAYGKAKGRDELCDRALAILDQLPAEKNSIVTQWDALGLASKSAYESQAQIQLYKEYCLHKKCLHCNIGHHFLSLHERK